MGWSGGLIDWVNSNTAYISVVFSWQLQQAYQRAVWLRSQGYHVCAGGPAVLNNPGFLAEVAETGGEVDALARHNPDATFTTRGCVRRCQFCIVHKIEPVYREIDDWPVRPIVCDNNLLAASDKHFNSVIDKLKPLKGVDFNQGLDARLMTRERADRLAELDLYAVRLSWDYTGMEREFMIAFRKLRDAGIPTKIIRVYCLIGFNDTPEDALYRLETVRALGVRPSPMRYQPLDALKRNSFVGPAWTERELRRYMRYFSRLRWLEHIPFAEYAG